MRTFHFEKEARPSSVKEHIAVLLLWALLGAMVGVMSFLPLVAIILGNSSSNAGLAAVISRTALPFVALSTLASIAIPGSALLYSNAAGNYSRLIWRSLSIAGMSILLVIAISHFAFSEVVQTFMPVTTPWVLWRNDVLGCFLLAAPAIVAVSVLVLGRVKRNRTVQPIVSPNAG